MAKKKTPSMASALKSETSTEPALTPVSTTRDEVGDCRSKRGVSPYTTVPITVKFGLGKTSYTVMKEFLQRYPKLRALSDCSCDTSISLSDVDDDVGHTLVHYLYTGAYQSLWLEDTLDFIRPNIYQGGVLTYCVAKRFEIDGLDVLAQDHIERNKTGVSIYEKLDVASKVYNKLPEDAWFTAHLKEEITAAFEQDTSLFVRADFVDIFGNVKSLDKALVKIIAEIYAGKLEARAITNNSRNRHQLLECTACRHLFPGSDFPFTRHEECPILVDLGLPDSNDSNEPVEVVEEAGDPTRLADDFRGDCIEECPMEPVLTVADPVRDSEQEGFARCGQPMKENGQVDNDFGSGSLPIEKKEKKARKKISSELQGKKQKKREQEERARIKEENAVAKAFDMSAPSGVRDGDPSDDIGFTASKTTEKLAKTSQEARVKKTKKREVIKAANPIIPNANYEFNHVDDGALKMNLSIDDSYGEETTTRFPTSWQPTKTCSIGGTEVHLPEVPESAPEPALEPALEPAPEPEPEPAMDTITDSFHMSSFSFGGDKKTKKKLTNNFDFDLFLPNGMNEELQQAKAREKQLEESWKAAEKDRETVSIEELRSLESKQDNAAEDQPNAVDLDTSRAIRKEKYKKGKSSTKARLRRAKEAEVEEMPLDKDVDDIVCAFRAEHLLETGLWKECELCRSQVKRMSLQLLAHVSEGTF